MSCDLDNLVTRLTSILKLGNDGFSSCVICDLLVGLRGQTAGYRLHYLHYSLSSLSSFLYYLLVWELSLGTTDQISSGRQVGAPATLQTISRDLSRLPPSTTTAERAAGWISQPSLSRFRRIFFEFYHLIVPVSHLENDEIFDINVVIVFLPSEAHRLGEIFDVYVCQRKAIVV